MILVLRALGVGDLVTAVPALRGLRAGLPGRELVLAAPDWLAPLAELTGAVDRVLPTTGPDRIAWTGAPPEVAVNLHGRGPQSHRALAAVRPGRMLAYGNPDAGHPDGPAWDDDEHEVRRWCRLLHACGLPADPGDLALRRPAVGGVPAGLTLLHPGSKIPAKRWPAQRFAGLARELTARGHRVAVTGSAGERALAERVARDGGLPPEAVLAGRTGLAELAALVAGARLVVSGDTGVAHLATGYGIASVVLFGPVPAAHWGPPADRPRHRALGAIEPTHVNPDSTGSRGVGSHPTLNAIGIDEVVAAVADVERVSGAVAA
ncbi:glycosyltransferase family 9 protein [Micromonospora chalcea]|uniref:glycosyltransferase family 9 protein n=1 Tax=Micromonospora chalcea TaxID=1874 RepID=UPI00157D9A1E|nr:glycosyltransferase family 9 protein [Micromonospora chalcea]